MNLKIISLIALIISASTSTINAMSEEKSLQACKKIGTMLFEASNFSAQLLKEGLISPACPNLKQCLKCQNYLIRERAKAAENYWRAQAIFNLHSTLPQMSNPQLDLVPLTGLQIAPVTLMITSFEVINKIDELLAFDNSINISAIKISNEEKNNTLKEIDELIQSIELMKKHINLIKNTTVEELKTWSQEDIIRCKNSFVQTKSHYTKAYQLAIKEYQDNTIPETTDFKTQILFTTSRKLIPLYKIIVAYKVINTIDKNLNLLNQK